MRLLRVGPPGRERPCVLDREGVVRDVSAWVSDWTGSALDPDFLTDLAGRLAAEATRLPRVDPGARRVGPAVRPGGHLVSIGLNYRDHAEDAGMPVPAEPVVASKSPWTLSGPYDDLLIPPGGDRTDWEVELAVVIGRRARYLPDQHAALGHLAGLCTANDVSERGWLLDRGGQWLKGKSFESFSPLGPYLVTPDEVGDLGSLRLTCRVNGRLMQHSSTTEMIFEVPWLLWYLSQFLVLEPGDVVLTGSPGGVALGRPDEPYLRPGDLVETEVAGLGTQRQRCRRAKTRPGRKGTR
ncbi:2-keto-4-pentenoate hydratase/2-oxohepta-3-ene-1,7-dioic acid hydratase in catechol pathway [Amycolatopsis cihanbeyliensis]|uniref:2-keto-4-pentenoate hydratase/2-oxohepta-3-ene-1,7-dioic acid hydratase in catechol pathway n=1 Tax=Amycolatopsis cihanbeyliensis TaxID=1128664 RepID=A0A542DBI5_AMYCI|nr:fumarylacetoacetate hydrolase family protein [Amycolatopsis cihanbeyliensis]TQJ00448.1 2-keto-4-pentenoate hydratase/2-oxohepta-3-ene-1,7-dioic acid hydratase in catechol pathway [Amycolatopsis cihanbeyliensis]